jgi:uncharacterized protein YerC
MRKKVKGKKEFLFALPPVNCYPSRKEWENTCWRKILKSRDFFGLLFTPYERHNFVMRAAVISRINAGKKYRQIGEELWLSSQTISSIKKAINKNSYRSYRERSKTERKKRVYSRDSPQTKRKPHGRPVRTKYGTIYLP